MVKKNVLTLSVATIFLLSFAISSLFAVEDWEAKSVPVSDTLYGVHFVDAKNGWAVGEYSVIIHTSDGEEWQEQSAPITSEALYDVYFVDAQKGWAVGGGGWTSDMYYVIIHTEDGGKNWTVQEDVMAGSILYGVCFVDANNGWAVGGGRGWEGEAIILHTSDGGKNWTMQDIPLATGDALYGVHFVNTQRGWAVGGAGETTKRYYILYTEDGGKKWTVQKQGGMAILQDVYFTDAQNGWAVGGGGETSDVQPLILHTTDGGKTWISQRAGSNDSGIALYGVYFVTSQEGWTVGDRWWSEGIVLYTKDAGGTWEQEGVSAFGSLRDAHDAGKANLWVVGQGGSVLKKTLTLPFSVVSIEPNNGKLAGGTRVTITGSMFEQGAIVTIGGAAATDVNFESSTTITVTTPPGAAGAVDVVVTNPGGESATGRLLYTYNPMPKVTGINPTSGAINGGNQVTITGTGFLEGATVTIGGKNATNVQVTSATAIRATVPGADVSGAVDVVVTNPDTQFAKGEKIYAYVPPPTISQITPDGGPIAGGTSVKIIGKDFIQGLTVAIGGNQAEVIEFSVTEITVKAPAGALGAKDVVVTNPDGQKDTKRNAYTYRSINIVLAPSTGVIDTSVKVTGSGYTANTDIGQLTFDDAVIPVVDVGAGLVIGGNINTDEAGAFEVAFVVPQHTGGTVMVAAGGAQANFKIAAQIISLKPEKGAAGTKIELSGNGYAASEEIQIDFGENVQIAKVKSDASGEIIASFEANAQSLGVKEIKATGLTSRNSATASFELLKSIPESVSVDANPPSLTANGVSTSSILITLKDAGNRLVIGETVTVTASDGNVTSPAQDNSDGTYTATYTSTTKAGKVTITAQTSNDKTGEKELTLTAGPAAKVTVEADPKTLPANGEAQSTVKATVKDANDNPVTTEKVEMAILVGGGKLEQVVNVGGGAYVAKYTAGTQEEIVTVKATTSNDISGQVNITLKKASLVAEPESGHVGDTVKVSGSAFEPNANIGKLSVNKAPIDLVADAGAGLVLAGEIFTDENGAFEIIFVIPKQPGGTLLIEAGGGRTMFEITSRIESITPESGAAGTQITIMGDGFVFSEDVIIDFGETQKIAKVKAAADGSFEATFEADVQAPGIKEVKATGKLSNRTGVAKFELTKTPAEFISVIADPNSLTADGVSQSTIQISVKDADDRAVIGEIVTIEASSGQIASPAEDKGDGTYTAQYTASTKSGAVTITATTSNGKSDTIEIILKPDEAANITVVAVPNLLAVNGKAEVTATVFDKHDNLVPTETVTMEVSGAGGNLSDVTNNADGTYVATYTAPNQQGVAKITARTSNDKTAETEINIKIEPDFAIRSLEPVKSGTAGETLLYIIEVSGQNRFNLPVSLQVSDLPEGAKGAFDKKTITPSIDESVVQAQLEVSIPASIAEGEYPFIVSGINYDKGIAHKAELTFKIEKAQATIYVSVTSSDPTAPKDIRLNEKTRVSGKIDLMPKDERTDLAVNLIYQFADEPPIQRTSVAKGAEREYFDEFVPDKRGIWKVKATWKGDNRYKPAERESQFEVGKGRSSIVLSSSLEAPIIGEKITITGKLIPQIADEKINLEITTPDKNIEKIAGIKTEEMGVFHYETELDQKGDWTFEATWKGDLDYEGVSKNLTVKVVKVGKAIIVLGGGDETTNRAWKTFNGIAEYVYKVFQRRHFTDDDIFFLSPSAFASNIIDKPTSEAWLKYAITEWAKERVNKHVPLYIYLLSHNTDDKFLLVKGDENVYLTPEMLSFWLDVLPEGTPVNIIIEACYSGNFITKTTADGKPALSRLGRIIITSAREDVRAELMPNRSSFSKYFFDGIEKNLDVLNAFIEASQVMKRLPQHSNQYPQLDANGDGIPNDDIDRTLLGEVDEKARVYIPDNIISLGERPEITSVTCLPEILKAGETTATIRAEVAGLNISRVFANITSPDYDVSQHSNWQTTYNELELFDEDGDAFYEAKHEKFNLPGAYTIVVYAENPEGTSMPEIITVKKSTVSWDVNGDGIVDILDLVLVGSHFGEEGENINGDVNGDGIVDILDLVLVGSHLYYH